MLKQLMYIILIAYTLTSCSTNRQSNGNYTKKHTTNKRTSLASNKNRHYKNKLEAHYKKYKAVPYKYGGTSRKGFDCSGFVQFTYKSLFNMDLPRTTGLMLKKGKPVDKKKLRVGDLVLFRTSRKYRHVGIFMGNNLFMHVSTKKGVMKSNLNNPYWLKHYLTSRRVLK